jgi:hypothetical protein
VSNRHSDNQHAFGEYSEDLPRKFSKVEFTNLPPWIIYARHFFPKLRVVLSGWVICLALLGLLALVSSFHGSDPGEAGLQQPAHRSFETG